MRGHGQAFLHSSRRTVNRRCFSKVSAMPAQGSVLIRHDWNNCFRLKRFRLITKPGWTMHLTIGSESSRDRARVALSMEFEIVPKRRIAR